MENLEYERLAWAVLFGHIAIIVVGGFMTVLSQSLVRALVGLIMTLLGVAGLFFLMAAPFIALMQILIYVGAVSVLIFFAIMLTSAWPGGDESGKISFRRIIFAGLAAVSPAIFLGMAAIHTAPPSFLVPHETEVSTLGRFFLEDFILPFELISLLLTVAMAGAVVLAFEMRRKK
ncbi:NADH-quinone oxidoreductase subunit J [Desulfonatronospira sp. MSAO_Bac3]|uniref:NADH-quinone oxidoreductase subunit J family protein n=1 Tax=Desulfonatronospira sp. MSAO_Bac3 TaxID=2293857 RepID=UPI000FF4F9F7|nr:NADH-quinone oxidoreductase subunit J [Desulfonatronospira sp. MSAO_Bac3]RQD78572.1 MAG: NADH-quinone oxidoreductase subunit J [Desulfonatronospira sp. MSAO_Bac3]